MKTKLGWTTWNSGGGCMISDHDFVDGKSVHVGSGLLILSSVNSEEHHKAEWEFNGESPYTLLVSDTVDLDLAFKLTPHLGQEMADAVAHDVVAIETNETSLDRVNVMTSLNGDLLAQFERYQEGLITDLECLRAMITMAHTTFTRLDVCTKCGTQNTGHHKEIYGGNICPACNPDKREYQVWYSLSLNKPSVVCYAHELTNHVPSGTAVDILDHLTAPGNTWRCGGIVVTRMV